MLCTVTVTADVADSQATEFWVDIAILRYWVVVVRPAPISSVSLVAPVIVVHDGVVRFVFDSQRYVIVPEPLPPEALLNDAGLPPLHIVWFDPIAPAVTALCTVTVTTDVAPDSQATEFWVDIVILRY